MGFVWAALIVVVFLVLLGVLVAKAPAPVRVLGAIGAVLLAAFVSFGTGVAYKRVLFYSSYVHWIRQYSAHLAALAEKDDCEKLKQTVLRFDERMKGRPEDAALLEDTMLELLQAGRYYRAPATGPTSCQSSDHDG